MVTMTQSVSFKNNAYGPALSRQTLTHHTLNLSFFSLGLSTIASSAQLAVPNPFDISLIQVPLFMLLVAMLPMLLGERAILKIRMLQTGLIALYYLASTLLFALNTPFALMGAFLISLVGMTAFIAPQRVALKQMTVFAMLAMVSALFLMTLAQL